MRPEGQLQLRTLLTLAWVLAGLVTLAALLPADPESSWTFDNTWFGQVHTVLPIVAIPIPLLGLRFSRDRRTRLVFAGGLAGAGLEPALALIETMARREVLAVPVVAVVLCCGLIVLAGLVAYQTLRDLPRGERRPQIAVVLVTLAALAGSGYLFASLLRNGSEMYVNDYLLCGLLGAVFLVPAHASIRVVQCGFALGATLSAALYLSQLFVSTDDPAIRTAMLVNLIFAAVALINLWPVWRSLPAGPVGKSLLLR